VTEDRFCELVRCFSEPLKLRLLRRLLLGSGTSLSVGELADELHLPLSTVSHHLNELKDLRLVLAARAGRFVYYGVGQMREELRETFQAVGMIVAGGNYQFDPPLRLDSTLPSLEAKQ
jgi:DNA-binding transcriptional ArsR family regulator